MVKPDISLIFPCRNEEQSIEECLNQSKKILDGMNINYEVIVSDSSSDNSREIINSKFRDIVLVKHDKFGYGNAYLEGIKAAKGKYILMMDADCTYEFRDIPRFYSHALRGNNFIIGNRMNKKMQKKAMPFFHKYFGNPFLTLLINILNNSKLKDSQSGFRLIDRKLLDSLNLKSKGMEFASEMIIKGLKKGVFIEELNTKYYRRKGESKLRPVKDGLRHIKYILSSKF